MLYVVSTSIACRSVCLLDIFYVQLVVLKMQLEPHPDYLSRYSSTCDTHVYIPATPDFLRRPCLSASDQKMDSSPRRQIIVLFLSDKTVSRLNPLCYTSLAYLIVSAQILLILFDRTVRASRPSARGVGTIPGGYVCVHPLPMYGVTTTHVPLSRTQGTPEI